MDVNAFYSLPLSERMELVNKQGEYLCRIKFYGYMINLYAFENSFIEVYYNVHTNTIAEIELLDLKDDRINLYVAQVNLSDLYSA